METLGVRYGSTPMWANGRGHLNRHQIGWGWPQPGTTWSAAVTVSRESNGNVGETLSSYRYAIEPQAIDGATTRFSNPVMAIPTNTSGWLARRGASIPLTPLAEREKPPSQILYPTNEITPPSLILRKANNSRQYLPRKEHPSNRT